MALCGNDSTKDRLENVRRILSFLCASLCAAREIGFTDSDMCGVQLIFWELEAELNAISSRIGNT